MPVLMTSNIFKKAATAQFRGILILVMLSQLATCANMLENVGKWTCWQLLMTPRTQMKHDGLSQVAVCERGQLLHYSSKKVKGK